MKIKLQKLPTDQSNLCYNMGRDGGRVQKVFVREGGGLQERKKGRIK